MVVIVQYTCMHGVQVIDRLRMDETATDGTCGVACERWCGSGVETLERSIT